ncbi:MAG: tRNA uridine-5-carboxymethylaminomethyl(34) synthesis enzyme MnmG [Spirochaetales bacterium]|jgi:tRNA uridine 5-carboxymethylaminomethyl modification enzyme|nr:tRNA uridine-5-carboxymethylaminomethyl(34) synthesis enzyme MnmG [Spirochaetales bacterium]
MWESKGETAIVVGGGHAGIEAALALARTGFEALLITQNLETIGRLSCNPSIGGLAKGNMVREIDALGGEMGKLIDRTMIQFRILNRRRGPAVQAPRAQADKFLYSRTARQVLENEKNLRLFQDTVVDIITGPEGRLEGVLTGRGLRIKARTVVITTGTFMEGRVFIGGYDCSSGRLGEPAALGLGPALQKRGFVLGRLKTGTPARVHAGSLDYGGMERQDGDKERLPFSFSHDRIDRPDLPCYITYTNPETHRIIRENIHRSPLYSGRIVGVGPRYCPSIEDKVVRFPQRDRHQIFVEPEGEDSREMYLNGLSSSLPEEVQQAFIQTLPGLRRAWITRPGYAVEYDYLDPTQLSPALMAKALPGLFFAGQTNGTSGYEEAAAQGLMAGLNASLFLRGMPPLVLSRAEAYIGVLIDDLVTRGTREPYRMFTSRAEYRLSLRHETADRRLTEKGFHGGLQTREALDRLEAKRQKIEEIRGKLKTARFVLSALPLPPAAPSSPEVSTPGDTAPENAETSAPTVDWPALAGRPLEQALKVPGVGIRDLLPCLPGGEAYTGPGDLEALAQVELDVKYGGYIARQEIQIKRFEKMETSRIPPDLDYGAVEGLSSESREKLKKFRPLSLGQAGRISGIRSSDLALLMVHLRRRRRTGEEPSPPGDPPGDSQGSA